MNPLLILRLAANDCKAKFAGSFLGSLWACAGPIVTVCVYWFVYTTALKGTPINGVPYVLWLISGIIPWFFLSDSICSAASCFNDYRFLVRKTRFKSEFLPLIRVVSSALVNIPIFVIAYFVITIGGIKPSCGQLWLIYWTLGSFVFIHGLSRITAVLCVYIKDLVLRHSSDCSAWILGYACFLECRLTQSDSETNMLFKPCRNHSGGL